MILSVLFTVQCHALFLEEWANSVNYTAVELSCSTLAPIQENSERPSQFWSFPWGHLKPLL